MSPIFQSNQIQFTTIDNITTYTKIQNHAKQHEKQTLQLKYDPNKKRWQ